MKLATRQALLWPCLALLSASALIACASKPAADAPPAAASSAASSAVTTAATPATAAKSSSSQASNSSRSGIGPGMNAKGEVVNASKVESGWGTRVKNGEWEGEITGKASAKSKFNKLKIGMSMKQVTDLIGQPTDQGAYITGKAFIPFYFGSDRYRHEAAYKGQGRLIFAGGSAGNITGANLIWIIHSSSETGYR